MKIIFTANILFCSLLFSFCSDPDETLMLQNSPLTNTEEPSTAYKYLALGDSYTIGQSVCETCNFPEQLKAQLSNSIGDATVDVKIIARTGWTTTNLITAVATQNPATDYDLVTLLIGVNNQFQGKPFSVYEQEFPELVTKAIAFAKHDPQNVIVVSIPDYKYTPFGTNYPPTVSVQIDQYNAFARNYCQTHNVDFVDITDITREGLNQPTLVANDGLHPSEIAYARFVERLLPKARQILLP